MNNSLMTLGTKLDAFFKCLANISLKNRSIFSVANLVTKICLESTFFSACYTVKVEKTAILFVLSKF